MSQLKLAEGKTKIIWEAGAGEVVIESKNDITAGDGLKHDLLEGKKIWSTTTTSNCFGLLEANHLRTHFVAPVSSDRFRAQRVTMIPLELVARRIATGSYLKRHPDVQEGTVFSDILLEFYEKDDTLSPPEAGDDTMNDPLIIFDPVSRRLLRYKPKRPMEVGLIDARPFDHIAWLDGVANEMNLVGRLADLTHAVFRVLERAWEMQGVALVDLKIECGFDPSGRLTVADVIDNDSWRIWPGGDKVQMRDKQVYRDFEDTDDPAAKAQQLGQLKDDYAWVAEATGAFVQ